MMGGRIARGVCFGFDDPSRQSDIGKLSHDDPANQKPRQLNRRNWQLRAPQATNR
jgi:hypothetical protein